MSIKAMVWAWEQDVPPSTKAVLLALADHSDDDGVCWPGLKNVAEKCRLSHRQVQRHISDLCANGLITRVERKRSDGGQTSNLFHLSVGHISHHPMTHMTPGDDAGDVGGMTLATWGDDAGVIPIDRTPREPPLEPSVPERESTVAVATSHTPEEEQEDQSLWPEWFSLGWGLPGWKVTYATASAWKEANGISDKLALEKVYALRDWWPRQPPGKQKSGKPYATWQHWCQRDKPKENVNGITGANLSDAEKWHGEKVRLDEQRERQRIADAGRAADRQGSMPDLSPLQGNSNPHLAPTAAS